MNTNIALKQRTLHAAEIEFFPYRMMESYLYNRTAGQGAFDQSDANAQFVLACDEENCLGGMRIHISNGIHHTLPLEHYINVKVLFNSVLIVDNRYAELSRLYIHPNSESQLHIFIELLKVSSEKLNGQQVSCVFVLIREHELSLYQQAAAVLGCRFQHHAVPQDFVTETLQNVINHKTIQVFCLEMR